MQNITPEISQIKLKIPKRLRKGRLRKFPKKSIESGYETLRYVAELLKVDDFSEYDILDYGCGVKFSQAILQYDLAINSYFGIDIDAKMIRFLQNNVHQSNMKYERVHFFNELYNNKGGNKMTEDYELPCGTQKFDLITMQSVMTHFNPQDFEVCLKMLKRYLKKDGKIFFTCILSKLQEEDFLDLDPNLPLHKASYKEAYALSLIEKAGLSIDSYNRRRVHKFLPEHIICSNPQNSN